jgi:hypothetical protein
MEAASGPERGIPSLHKLEDFSPIMEEFPGREIGSVEFLMEHDRYKRLVKPMRFADVEE